MYSKLKVVHIINRIGITRGARLIAIWMLCGSLWDSAALSLFTTHSYQYKIALLSGWPDFVGYAFIACLLMQLPFAFLNIFSTKPCRIKTAVRLAAMGALLAALIWVGLEYIARHADLSVIRSIYLRKVIEALAFAVFISSACNLDRKSELGIKSQDFGKSNRLEIESK